LCCQFHIHIIKQMFCYLNLQKLKRRGAFPLMPKGRGNLALTLNER
jgi:hypothetical protein